MAAREAALNLHRGGEGEPLVLMHGLGLSLRTWLPVVPALERRHDVIALDLPGFGDSPPLPAGTPSTVPALADAVEGVLDGFGLDRAHAAGNSLGGWVALELARRGRARSVVGLSPAGMWTGREIAYARRNLDLQRNLASMLPPPLVEALARTAAGRTFLLAGAMSRPWRPEAVEAARLVKAAIASRGWRQTLDWTSARRAEGLEEIRCPVLIAWGSRDTLLLPRQGPRFLRRIPHAEHRPLRGLGHVPMWDDPELVASTIVEFTQRAARRGASAQTAAAGS